MKNCIEYLNISLLALSICASSGYAEEPERRLDFVLPVASAPPDPGEALESVTKAILSRLKAISTLGSLEYFATCQNTFNEASQLLLGELRFAADGQKYRYDIVPVRRQASGDELSFSSSFDGTVTQKLSKGSGEMTIGNGLLADGDTLYMRNYFFLPDVFFEAILVPARGFVLKPADFADTANWKNVVHAIHLKGRVKIGDTTCYAVEIPVEKELLTGLPAIATIYLDIDKAGFPRGWDLTTKERQPIYRYRVEETDTLFVDHGKSPFVFPKRASFVAYIENLKPVGKITNTSMIVVNKCSAGKQIDPERFSIDPAMARGIYDRTEKTYIPVPR